MVITNNVVNIDSAKPNIEAFTASEEDTNIFFKF